MNIRDKEDISKVQAEDGYRIQAARLKALAHPTRLKIVSWLWRNRCNVQGISKTYHIPQATVSQHIAILRYGRIIEGERHGAQICYKVVDKQVIMIIKALGL